jgi:hypothetical protein
MTFNPAGALFKPMPLAVIFFLLSALAGCVVSPPGKIRLYEGDERPTDELALIDFCAKFFRRFPHKHVVKIDGKDAHLAARSHASALGVVPCRAWITAGEHQVYFYAKGKVSSDFAGERVGTPSSFEGVVDFKAGKTYYFIYDSTGGWPFPVATGVWIEDEDGNVVAGEKVKAFGRH